MSIPPVKLLDHVRALTRMKHYAIRTEEACVLGNYRIVLRLVLSASYRHCIQRLNLFRTLPMELLYWESERMLELRGKVG